MGETPGEARRTEAEILLQDHLPMLKSYLRHLVGSGHDADDLAQDICVTLLKEPEILLKGTDPAAYLRGIARHFANRHHRRVKRDSVLEAVMEVAWEAEAPAETASEQRALAGCMEGLSENLRQIVRWRYTDGLNSRQIAEKLSMSSDAVRMSLARSRQALAKCLQGKLPQAEGSAS